MSGMDRNKAGDIDHMHILHAGKALDELARTINCNFDFTHKRNYADKVTPYATTRQVSILAFVSDRVKFCCKTPSLMLACSLLTQAIRTVSEVSEPAI